VYEYEYEYLVDFDIIILQYYLLFQLL